MYKSEEQKKLEWQRIRENIQITDLAEEYGFTLVKRGSYISLKEHDSVMINPKKNIFIRNSRPEAAGSCIDFAKEFGNYESMHAILKDFASRISGSENIIKYEKQEKPTLKESHTKVQIQLPERDNNVRNVFAYLTSTRGIDKNIVSEFIADRRLYQDSHKNCVFVSRNDEGAVQYAGLRGTSYKKFMGDIKGCDYTHCFYINHHASSMVVTESVIDTMSHMSFDRKNNFSDKKINYLALSSANKYEAIMTHLKEHPEINTVYLALDNDKAGHEFTSKIQEMLKGWHGTVKLDYPSIGKDWNEQLVYCKNNNIRYDFFQPQDQELGILTEYCKERLNCYKYGNDPRLYTQSKKRKDIIESRIMESDIPDTLIDYVDLYFQDNVGLQTREQDPEIITKEVVTHYNQKNKDFSGIENDSIKQTENHFKMTSYEINKTEYAMGGE